ncbi:MAG: 16S rRNA (adenine(1518)-N(6)/adenine(1519)-N(6))-dimethyltransferase RsmA [Clostridia bacterium]|nr:16S rRNA (adenine(1518)-N(6)/adenine(1519)-N(6))-dimethyltransferase RsmA [Clostridia bacterium]
MNLCNPSVVRALMAEEGITFRKEFGQNFLIDFTVPERIADSCADREDVLILEIGPGIGCLTKELALRYSRVVAIEIDNGLIPILERTMAEFDNVRVVHGDVMEIDLAALITEEAQGREVAVCANLPYYITTPILMRLLECGVRFSSITVMVQNEVAARLAAAPGKGDYGAITAVLGYHGTVKKLFTVPAGCFMPAPKVSSAVVRMDLYRENPHHPKDEHFFFSVIRAAFGMRRKTLCNALAVLGGFDKEGIAVAIEECGFPADVRGERLSTADFVRLSNALLEKKNI